MDYLYPCLAFVWIAYLWETYLQWRQRRVYRSSLALPDEVKEIMDDKTFNKSRIYQLDKSSYSLAHDLFKQLEFLIIIAVGAIPFAWNLAGSIIMYYGYTEEYEVTQSLVFLLISEFYSTATALPWTVYYTFVLEERHGFNKQTASFFIKDQLKKLILSIVLNLSIMAGLISVIKWGGDYFYIYAWLFVLVVSLTFVFLYHDFIAPCFDKYTPLPEGSLREAIEQLATSLNFPLKKLLVVEGSKRSAHSNAYFYGFWKNKCIVLFDTLVEEGILGALTAGEEEKKEGEVKEEIAGSEGKGEEGGEKREAGMEGKEEEEREEGDVKEREQEEEGGDEEDEGRGEVSEEEVNKEGKESKKKKGCNTEEVLGVLAHELGHWKLSHNLKNIVITELNLLLTLFLFGYFMNQQDLYSSFGFPSSRPVLIGLILFLQLVFLPYHEVFSFCFTQLTRRFEYQADAFAIGLGRAVPLASALIKLNKDNLSFPVADPLYSAFHHSHPTLLERLRVLHQHGKKTD